MNGWTFNFLDEKLRKLNLFSAAGVDRMLYVMYKHFKPGRKVEGFDSIYQKQIWLNQSHSWNIQRVDLDGGFFIHDLLRMRWSCSPKHVMIDHPRSTWNLEIPIWFKVGIPAKMPQLVLSSFALKNTLLRTKKYHYSKALFEDDDFPISLGWDMFSFPSVILFWMVLYTNSKHSPSLIHHSPRSWDS